MARLPLQLGTGVDVAACCIFSALFVVPSVGWDRLITLRGELRVSRGGGEGKGKVWGAGNGEGIIVAPGLHCFASRGNVKSAVHPYLVQHGIQEGALTPALECDAVCLECYVRGMSRWRVR